MPNEGDLKVEQFYAWLPVVCGWRVRWLCRVRVEYIFVWDDGTQCGGWTPNRFLR